MEVFEIIPLISIKQHLRIKSIYVATKPTNKTNKKKHKHFLLKREDGLVAQTSDYRYAKCMLKIMKLQDTCCSLSSVYRSRCTKYTQSSATQSRTAI